MEQLRVGNVVVASISEVEDCKVEISFLFNDLSLEDMRRNSDWLDTNILDIENHKLGFAFRAYAFKLGNETVLVDACNGNHKQRPTAPWQHNFDRPNFIEELKSAGIAPQDVDYVICTHLHCDHVGWLTQLEDGDWTPTFHNALHVFSRIEFRFYEDRFLNEHSQAVNHGSFEDSVLPIIRSCRYTLAKNDAVLIENTLGTVKLVPSPGHSIDHLCVSITSLNEEAIICGDAVHHPIQLDMPLIPMRADYDPELAVKSRLSLLSHCAETGAWLLAGHFSQYPFAQVKKYKDRFRIR